MRTVQGFFQLFAQGKGGGGGGGGEGASTYLRVKRVAN